MGFCDIIAAFFGLSFWQELVTTVLGVGLGFWGALWIERRGESGRRAAERAELSTSLRRTLQHNWSLVGQAETQLKNKEWPTYPLDLALLNATARRQYEIFPPANTRLIDDVRYELIHFDEKLRLLREMMAGNLDLANQPVREIIGSVLVQAGPLRDKILAAIRGIP